MPLPVIQTFPQKGVFISSGSAYSDQTVPGSIQQMSRIQGVEIGINYPLQQLTYNDGGDESYLNANNSIALGLKWLHSNGLNEFMVGLMGFEPPSGYPGYNLEQEKNIYITLENQAGVDAVGATGYAQTKTVIGIGQALMTEYNLSAQVGGIIQSQAAFTCLTSFVYNGSSGYQVPAIHAQDGSQLTGLFVLPSASSQYDINGTGISTGSNDYVSAIAATDLVMLFPNNSPFATVFSGNNQCYLQSVNVSLSYNRYELKPLGYAFPPNRAILYPMNIDVTTDAIVNSYQADQLQRISCLSTGQSVYIIVKQPCSSATLFGLYFTELQLAAQSFSTSISNHDTVSFHWKGILSTPQQTFFDPTVNYLIDLSTSGAYGTHW